MPANGRRDLILRLKVNYELHEVIHYFMLIRTVGGTVPWVRLFLTGLGSIPGHFLLNFMVDSLALGHVSPHQLRIFLSLPFHLSRHINSSPTLYYLSRWQFHFATKHPPSLCPPFWREFRFHQEISISGFMKKLTLGTALTGVCAFGVLGFILVAKATGTWSL